MARKKKNKSLSVDPGYYGRHRKSLKRTHRKSVFFNDREIAVIEEYCRRYKVKSRSALIRQSVMQTVMDVLDDNPPTLF